MEKNIANNGKIIILQNKPKRNLEWDIAKLIAIFMVVLEHCLTIVLGEDIFFSSYLWAVIWSIQMPLFMVASGFFCRNTKIKTWNDYGTFFIRKTIHLLIPFFSYLFFYGLIVHFYTFWNYIASTIYVIENGLWFLWVLWVLSIFLGTAQFISNNISFKHNISKIFFIFALFFLLLLPCFILMNFTKILGIHLIAYYSLFFALGFFIYCFEKELSKIWTNKIIFWPLFIVSLIGYSIFISLFNSYYAETPLELLLRIFQSTIGVYLIYSISLIFVHTSFFKTISIFGRYTLELYYCQGFSLLIVRLFFNSILINKPQSFWSLNGIWFGFLFFFITLVISYLLIFSLKSNKITNLLCFGKIREKFWFPLKSFSKTFI